MFKRPWAQTVFCVFSVCECCAKIAVSTSVNYEPDRIGVPAGWCTPSCKCISVRVYFLILVRYWSAYGQNSLILIQCHFQLLSNYRFNSLWPSNVMWWQRYLGQHWLRWWLVAWRHQAISWNIADFGLVSFCGIHLRGFSLRVLKLLYGVC